MPSRMAFFRAFFSVDPAHAGMILHFFQGISLIHCGPRACGDDPKSVLMRFMAEEWTPRMRG